MGATRPGGLAGARACLCPGWLRRPRPGPRATCSAPHAAGCCGAQPGCMGIGRDAPQRHHEASMRAIYLAVHWTGYRVQCYGGAVCIPLPSRSPRRGPGCWADYALRRPYSARFSPVLPNKATLTFHATLETPLRPFSPPCWQATGLACAQRVRTGSSCYRFKIDPYNSTRTAVLFPIKPGRRVRYGCCAHFLCLLLLLLQHSQKPNELRR